MGNLQQYINKKHFFLKKIMGVISFLKQSQNKQKFKTPKPFHIQTKTKTQKKACTF